MDNIKLVIWDMDDTFRGGAISEGKIDYLKENHELVIELINNGVMNTIYSNNDFDIVESKLRETGLWKTFPY